MGCFCNYGSQPKVPSLKAEGPHCVGCKLQKRTHANAQGDPMVAAAAVESPAGRHGTCKHTPVREVQRMTCHVGEQNENNNNKTVTGSGKSASATLPWPTCLVSGQTTLIQQTRWHFNTVQYFTFNSITPRGSESIQYNILKPAKARCPWPHFSTACKALP